MNLVVTVVNISAPVFLLAAFGFLWVRLGFEYRVQFVTRLAMSTAVPCLIFTALVDADVTPSALSEMTIAAFAAYGAVALIFLGFTLVFRLNRQTYLAPLIYGNTGNLGLPLALFAYGVDGLSLAVVVFAVTSIMAFTLGVWLVSGGGSPTAVFKEPLVGATLAGALFLWQGWQLPDAIFNSMKLMGQMAIPLMLMTLGVAVARLKPQNYAKAAVISLVKIGTCAAVGFAMSRMMGLSETASAILILQMATPVAVTSYLLAEKYGADSDAVAGLTVVSTLLSVLTLPVLLAILL